MFAGVLLLGQAVVARHRAAAAADLAALAAAATWAHGPDTACATALRVARAQGAELAGCRLGGEVAEVEARVAAGPFTPRIRARAGPPAAGPEDPRTRRRRPDSSPGAAGSRVAQCPRPSVGPSGQLRQLVGGSRGLVGPPWEPAAAQGPQGPVGPSAARRGTPGGPRTGLGRARPGGFRRGGG
ncbi:Rv3654c family TadE-like protein [Streptomyces sp. WAC05950]|uniref:Rv3654c family TadE-like protein n=1 Tax=Streptomyces sp. WAC05950 TaxID=2487419 RepID=UPI0037DDA99A